MTEHSAITSQLSFFSESRSIIPRQYQSLAHEQCFELWNRGTRGCLIRIFTGGGKTITACLIMEEWLKRGPLHKCMVISYEKQLVWQFAQEIEDVLGIHPGIEMESEKITDAMPPIVVASRQTLAIAKPPMQKQIEELATRGVPDLGACNARHAARFLNWLDRGADPEDINDEIRQLNQYPEANGTQWSRLFKFDNNLHWMVCFDEAHKHSYRLRTVKPIIDWFETNPEHRRLGMTATPKRFDGVSLGDKMFPGIAIDYPLFCIRGRCAVKDGYAVPYIQKYIEVQGVDFRQIKKVAGDYDEAELERVLNEEKQLASLCQPMLDLVGDRRTLIFSPGVDMARAVAAFINARCKAQCKCGHETWYPKLLIGDGAKCEKCHADIDVEHVTYNGRAAETVNGAMHPIARRQIYEQHQRGDFQFLSVCGLCREGYNDREIAAVAVFRPVSKAASSLAEQMKGRGSRPLPNLIEGVKSTAQRLKLIRESSKPNCLIIDLTGITGLDDCSSTLDIYSQGLPDDVKERAEEKLYTGEVENVEEAIQKSEEEIAEEKAERKRRLEERREEEYAAFAKQAKSDPKTLYTEHEWGIGLTGGPNSASYKQYKYLRFLGFEIHGREITKRQATRMIDQIKSGVSLEMVAYTNGITEEHWHAASPSVAQKRFLRRRGVAYDANMTPQGASDIISAVKDPEQFYTDFLNELNTARTQDHLNHIGRRFVCVEKIADLPVGISESLIAAGRKRRASMNAENRDF